MDLTPLTATLATVQEAQYINLFHYHHADSLYDQDAHWLGWKADKLYAVRLPGYKNGILGTLVGYYIKGGGGCTVCWGLNKQDVVSRVEVIL